MPPSARVRRQSLALAAVAAAGIFAFPAAALSDPATSNAVIRSIEIQDSAARRADLLTLAAGPERPWTTGDHGMLARVETTGGDRAIIVATTGEAIFNGAEYRAVFGDDAASIFETADTVTTPQGGRDARILVAHGGLASVTWRTAEDVWSAVGRVRGGRFEPIIARGEPVPGMPGRLVASASVARANEDGSGILALTVAQPGQRQHKEESAMVLADGRVIWPAEIRSIFGRDRDSGKIFERLFTRHGLLIPTSSGRSASTGPFTLISPDGTRRTIADAGVGASVLQSFAGTPLALGIGTGPMGRDGIAVIAPDRQARIIGAAPSEQGLALATAKQAGRLFGNFQGSFLRADGEVVAIGTAEASETTRSGRAKAILRPVVVVSDGEGLALHAELDRPEIAAAVPGMPSATFTTERFATVIMAERGAIFTRFVAEAVLTPSFGGEGYFALVGPDFVPLLIPGMRTEIPRLGSVSLSKVVLEAVSPDGAFAIFSVGFVADGPQKQRASGHLRVELPTPSF